MARKYFTLVVLCVLMCASAFGQGNTKGDVQVLCYPACTSYNEGSMDGSAGTGTGLYGTGVYGTMSSVLQSFIGSGGDTSPTQGFADTTITPNSDTVETTQAVETTQVNIGGVVRVGNGWSAINFGHDVSGGGWTGSFGYQGTNNAQGFKAIVRSLANRMSGMPGLEGMHGGGIGGIPLPENMRNFSAKDLLLGRFDKYPKFGAWGGGKGRLGKIGAIGDPDFIIPQVRSTIAFGGKIRFNLEGFSITKAMDPGSWLYWGAEQNWTSKEFQAIINNWDEFKDHVLFYTGPYEY